MQPAPPGKSSGIYKSISSAMNQINIGKSLWRLGNHATPWLRYKGQARLALRDTEKRYVSRDKRDEFRDFGVKYVPFVLRAADVCWIVSA